MAQTTMELFDEIIGDVKEKMQEEFFKRYLPCDHKLLGTLLAVKKHIERLDEENEEREKAIEYLSGRRGVNNGNIDD